MNKVRVLLVGAAFSADLHMDGYARFRDLAQVVAICDKNEERVHELARRYGIEGYEAYTDLHEAIARVECDMVDVCLPNFLHRDAVIAALERGRNVISEKPLATTVEDARAMADAAARTGRHLYYAEDWLFSPAIRKALAIVDEGAIGKTHYIRARECHSGSHSPFAQTIKFCGGGCMVHLGVHPVAFLLSLKNNEWTEVVAMTSGGLENNYIHKGMEGEDWAACLMRFADGTSALLEANYVTSGGMEDIIDFYGEKGCLHVDLNFTSALSCFSIPGVSYTVEKAEITTGWSRPAVDEKYNLGYVDEIRHFIDCCAADTDAKPGLRGIDGLETLEVIRCIYESARTGAKVVNPKRRA